LVPLATLEQAWREFFFTPEPAVTVAVFRILFGVILVVHGLLLWPHASLWYGPLGFLPYKQYFQIYGRSRFSVFHFLPDSDLTAKVVLAVFIMAAASLSLGILTTVSACLTFLLLISIHNRNPAVLHGGDDVLRVMAFLLIFSSAGAELSVDRFASSGQPFVGEYTSPWALRLMQLQVSIIYLRAGLAKLGGASWLEGSAAYYPTQVQEYRRFPLPKVLARPFWIRLATWGTILVELGLGTAVWVTELRFAILLCGLAFHLVLEYFTNLQLFGWTMMCCLLLFVSPTDLMSLLRLAQ
jgi:Vitamin K-dependent gamma-carboxylase